MTALRQAGPHRLADWGGHDPYRRLPSLVYDLFGAETPAHVRSRIAGALELLVAHDSAEVVESEPGDLRAALAGQLAPERPARAVVHGDALEMGLVAYGARLGVLRVHRAGGFGPQDVSFLGRFAELAALALYNSHALAELNRLAFTDPLTGLANRRRLADELAARSFDARGPTLLLLDFDGLKGANDMLGYEAGDALICAVARVLQAQMRPGETAARLGGDEFVAVLPDVGEAEAERRADELSAAIDDAELPAELRAHFSGASVGAVTSAPGEPHGELLRRAGADMHARKRARKTRGGTGAPASFDLKGD